MTDHAAGRRGVLRRARVVVPIILVVLLLAAAAWVIGRGLMAKSELESLADSAGRLEQAVQSRDVDAVETEVRGIAAHADRAAELTSDTLWRATEAIPGVGANTAAVRIASTHTREVAEAALPVLGLFRDLGEQAPGGVDLDALIRAQEPLARLAGSFQAADAALSAIRTGELVGPVADGVGRLATAIADGTEVADGVSAAARITPGMLGADGTRHVLLMLQNPAELRSGGGLSGSFALLTAKNGEVTLTEQVDSSKFRRLKEDIVPVPASTSELYGDVVGRHVQNASMTADFGLTVDLVTAWWRTHSDIDVDAVLSIDPRVLAALLTVTGPVPLPQGGSISADNLVQVMLVEPYLTLDGAAQTRIQRAATQAVVERVLGGGIDLFAWATALAGPIDEGRVALWSAHPEEQALLGSGSLAGPLARHQAAGEDAYAVYFNDITTGKMDSYLDVAIASGTAQCRPDGRSDVAVSVTLTSLAPPEARTFPILMTGADAPGIERGDIATLVTVAGPADAGVGGVWDGEGTVPSTNVIDNGFPSSAARITLAPGQSKTLEFRFIASGAGEPVVLHTPLLRDVILDSATPACR